MSGRGRNVETTKKVSNRTSSRLRLSRKAQSARGYASTFFKTVETVGYPWHVDHEHRRTKTSAELIEGCERIELYDRRPPGKYGRVWR